MVGAFKVEQQLPVLPGAPAAALKVQANPAKPHSVDNFGPGQPDPAEQNMLMQIGKEWMAENK
jgi:hypothetical protein